MIEQEELLSVIPHRGRMLLLNKVRNYNTKELSVEGEYCITEDCLFYDSAAKGVPVWVGFEFIAQAVSALTGIGYRERGEVPKTGFILSISQLQIGLSFFAIGSIITIKAKQVDHMDSHFVFSGEIFVEGEKVLEGKITLIEVDNTQTQAMIKEKD